MLARFSTDAAVVPVVAGIPQKFDVLNLFGRIVERLGASLTVTPPVDAASQIQLTST
jgi:hypothetical protein